MTKRSRIFFEVAREMSLFSDYKRARLGAVVVEGKRIVSTGHNSQKTNPTQYKYNRYREFSPEFPARVHAEVAALNPLIGRPEVQFSKLELYVYRELKDGTRAMARPCPSCMALIRDLGIKKIYYSTPDGFAEESI